MGDTTTYVRVEGETNQSPPPTRLPVELGPRLRWAAPWFGMLVLAGMIAPFRDSWAVQFLLLIWVSFAPGRLALAALRMKSVQVRRFPTYVVAMSLMGIIVTGLIADGVGVVFGDDHPLRTAPLWFAIIGLYVALTFAAMCAPPDCRPNLLRVPSAGPYVVLLLPLAAAAGALRLNSAHGSDLAIIAMVAALVVWIAAPFVTGFTWRSASITVYSVALAGMWSFSLRGDSVYGYDIANEYFIAERTINTGVWHLSHSNDSYGSLLSLTVLPASLHSITGVTALVIFKAVYPAFLAFVPVAVLRLAGRLVRIRWAYVSGGLIIGQYFFMSGLPAVARQEIAFVFLACVLGGLLEGSGRRHATALVPLCAVGVIFAHYSTAYLATATFGVTTVLMLIGRIAGRRPPVRVLGSTFVVFAVGAALWYGVLTHSASNVSQVWHNFRQAGFSFLPNRSGNVVSTLVSGNVPQPLSPADYASHISARYAAQYPFIKPLSGATSHPLTSPSPRPTGGILASLSGNVIALINIVVDICALIGSAILSFGRRSRSRISRIFGLFGLGTGVLLVLIRVSGTLARYYNLERTQLQGFLVLAPVAVYACARSNAFALGLRIVRRHSVPRHSRLSRVCDVAAVMATGVLIATAVGLSSDHPSLNGRGNVSATGDDAARFVVDDRDLLAAEWLETANPGLSELTYADVYGGLRLVITNGGLTNVLSDLTPETLSRGAWIYEYSANVGGRRIAQATFDGRGVEFEFPTAFVNSNYDTVYTNGRAKILRG